MINILQTIIDLVMDTGIYGVFFSCGILIIESIIPIIPILVFISINYMLLGNILGFLVSWICVVIGSLISYFIFKNGFGNHFDNLTRDKEKIKKYTKLFKHISTDKLLFVIAFPFTPAFIVNIVAGLVKMDFKKFFIALIFGKISLVIYSAYIGLSFVESLTNPYAIIKIIVVIISIYILYVALKRILKINV